MRVHEAVIQISALRQCHYIAGVRLWMYLLKVRTRNDAWNTGNSAVNKFSLGAHVLQNQHLGGDGGTSKRDVGLTP